MQDLLAFELELTLGSELLLLLVLAQELLAGIGAAGLGAGAVGLSTVQELLALVQGLLALQLELTLGSELLWLWSQQ